MLDNALLLASFTYQTPAEAKPRIRKIAGRWGFHHVPGRAAGISWANHSAAAIWCRQRNLIGQPMK